MRKQTQNLQDSAMQRSRIAGRGVGDDDDDHSDDSDHSDQEDEYDEVVMMMVMVMSTNKSDLMILPDKCLENPRSPQQCH